MGNSNNVKNVGKSIFEKSKEIGGIAFEKGKELGGLAVEKGGKALKEAKINAEIFALKHEIKKSKVTLGDMIYQANVETGIKEIDELKKLIKNALEEIKYLESKKAK